MAESSIRVYGSVNTGTIAASSYTNTGDIPDGNKVAIAPASNINNVSYCHLGSIYDTYATRFRVVRGGKQFAILNRRKVIEWISSFASYMRVPMNTRGFYSEGYQYHSHRTQNVPSVSYVTFPGPGNYRVNFQADYVTGIGRYNYGIYNEYPEEYQSVYEVGYTYRAFYGLRLDCASGRKWIAVAHNLPTRQYVNDVYSFTITAADYGNGGRFPVYCFLASRDGHSWSEYGTAIGGAYIQFDFA